MCDGPVLAGHGRRGPGGARGWTFLLEWSQEPASPQPPMMCHYLQHAHGPQPPRSSDTNRAKCCCKPRPGRVVGSFPNLGIKMCKTCTLAVRVWPLVHLTACGPHLDFESPSVEQTPSVLGHSLGLRNDLLKEQYLRNRLPFTASAWHGSAL